jgi:hypothetical protein
VGIVTKLQAGRSGFGSSFYFLRSVQTGSGGHPAFYSTATGTLSSGVKENFFDPSVLKICFMGNFKNSLQYSCLKNYI